MILDVIQDTALETTFKDLLKRARSDDATCTAVSFSKRTGIPSGPCASLLSRLFITAKKKNTLRKRIKKSVSQSEHLINH